MQLQGHHSSHVNAIRSGILCVCLGCLLMMVWDAPPVWHSAAHMSGVRPELVAAAFTFACPFSTRKRTNPSGPRKDLRMQNRIVQGMHFTVMKVFCPQRSLSKNGMGGRI